ncbi:P-loop NTPase fold protein [Pseudomonas viridiflava]|uniref:P-loop NTPase fold protein n=2 Tax=Pseudomonas viridiflava TaxID=33069 RepID=UPI000F034A52|nr:P-loop NTPase fold protein [Pseudomonas viridiflava]
MDTLNQHISQHLEAYLTAPPSEHAVLVSGNWGAGKTFYIDSFIEHHTTEKLKLIKVSLFGLQNTADIEHRILADFYPIVDSKSFKFLGEAIRKVGGMFNFNLFGDDKPDLRIDIDAKKLNLYNSFISGRSDFALILDDVERSDIEIQKLLGYINHVVETCHIKTILIANESELIKKHQGYLSFKEKVISDTFEIRQDAEQVINSFLKTSPKTIQSFRKNIIETYVSSNSKNLRSLKQTIASFSRIYSRLDDKFKGNENYISALTRTFFSLSLEIKSGTISKEELLKGNLLNHSSKFIEKYFSTSHPVFTESLWADVFFSGDDSQLNHFTEQLPFFKQSEARELDMLDELSSFQNLPEKEFGELRIRLETSVASIEDESPLTFLKKANLLATFMQHNLSTVSISLIINYMRKHLEKYENSLLWAGTDLSHYVRYEFTHLRENAQLAEQLENYLKKHATAYENARLERSKNHASQKIMDFYKATATGDRGVLVKTLIKEHPHTVFFTKLDADTFVSALLNGENQAFDNFSEIAGERYLMDRLRLNRGSDELTLELDFWKSVQVSIAACLSEAEPLKRYNLEKFMNSTIPNFCSMLAPEAID